MAIPEYIEGYPVTQIGVPGSKKYGIKSDNLNKIYISHTVYSKLYMGWPLAADSVSCKDEVVFLTSEKINLGGISQNDTKFIMMPDAFERSTQGLLEDFIANLVYNPPNIIYYFNYVDSPNQDVYWFDFIMEDSLYLNPETPIREGYLFTGWYVDIDCHEQWDGVNSSEGENIMELYAGWEQEQN